jgi:hypothetical protein
LRNSQGIPHDKSGDYRGELLNMSERSTVIGVFEDPKMAQQAIQELKRTGFSNEQIGFVLRNHDVTEGDTTSGEAKNVAEERADDIARGIIGGVIGAADLLLLPVIGPSPAANALETALPAAEEVIDTIRGTSDTDHEAKEGAVSNEAKVETKEDTEALAHETRVNEGVGVVSGGVMGGVLGAASALSIPGIGPVIAGGILIAALAGAAIGAVSGGYLSAFTNIGVPEKKVDHYRREFEAGHIIVTVKTNGREQEVVDLLRRNGAHDVQTYHTF